MMQLFRVLISRWTPVVLAMIPFLGMLMPEVRGQLTVLSAGNVNLTWRSTQLELINGQLADAEIKGKLRDELEAQREWLSSWKAGSLSTSSWADQAEGRRLPEEPTVDPTGKASPLRARLLGDKAQPTLKDTQALANALKASPNDVGLRQLHLHWLDQKQYRKEYAGEIAEAAGKVATMLAELQPQDEQLKLARGYCLYRRARALVYRELPEVVAQKPIQDLKLHEAELVSAYRQLIELVGSDHPEFILIEIRMLRRDHWYGQALMLLEKHAKAIEPKWFLKKRRDLLSELGWTAPAQEAAQVYAQAFPEEAASESSTGDSSASDLSTGKVSTGNG